MGLLQRSYYQQSHRTKARIWAASIAKFCEKRTQPPRSARVKTKKKKERRSQEKAQKGKSSNWDPKWSQWNPRTPPRRLASRADHQTLPSCRHLECTLGNR